jgi:hypothetical protein
MTIGGGIKLSTEEGRNLKLLGHSDMNGHGATMQVIGHGDHLYVGHFKPPVGVSVLDVSDPRNPRVVKQIPALPGTRCLKLQVANDLLVVSNEQFGAAPARTGIAVYELTNPADPRQVGFFETRGRGPHWMWFADGRYVYAGAHIEGFTHRIVLIVDLKDPANPREIGRWWIPGMWTAGGEKPWWDPALNYNIHGLYVVGDRLYLAMMDACLGILDISDKTAPCLVSQLQWFNGRTVHTVLPLPKRDLLIVTEETLAFDCMEYPEYIRVIDIRDEQNPRILSRFPSPPGDFRRRGMRCGCHDVHVNYPGSMIDDRLIYTTNYNAGLRVVDISDPVAPKEVAYYVPQAPPTQKTIQTNQVYVDARGIIYLTDIEGAGLHILAWARG